MVCVKQKFGVSMKRFALCIFFISGFVNAADQESIVVTIAPANVCYNATIVDNMNGVFVKAVSSQITCGDKPARILPILAFRKEGQECLYTVGKALNHGRESPWNTRSAFHLLARCPTSQK
jgi:hypothetical protein